MVEEKKEKKEKKEGKVVEVKKEDLERKEDFSDLIIEDTACYRYSNREDLDFRDSLRVLPVKNKDESTLHAFYRDEQSYEKLKDMLGGDFTVKGKHVRVPSEEIMKEIRERSLKDLDLRIERLKEKIKFEGGK